MNNVARDRRPRPIRGKCENARCAGELVPPELQLPPACLVMHTLFLPYGVVGVLHRELRRPRVFPSDEGPVVHGQFGGEHTDRHAIDNGVMEGEHQYVLALAQPYEQHAPQRPRRQVERLRDRTLRHRSQFALSKRRWHIGEVDGRHQGRTRRRHHLEHSFAFRAEGGAQ
jgi:hypothetical protein